MFEWVAGLSVAVQVNDLLFVHGGLSQTYCGMRLQALTDRAHAALRILAEGGEGLDILIDPLGPLWYRGLAGVEPAAPPALVDAILARHGVRHLVVAHTPTQGIVWPRLDARVILIDTGIGAAYGGHPAWLEATPDGLFAGYPGGRVRLPADDAGRAQYLDAVIAMHPANTALASQRDALVADRPDAIEGEPEDAGTSTGTMAPPAAITCDTRP
jgi:hypothetical protein